MRNHWKKYEKYKVKQTGEVSQKTWNKEYGKMIFDENGVEEPKGKTYRLLLQVVEESQNAKALLNNIGSFNEVNLSGDKNSNLYSTYLDDSNLNFRLGGKLLIFSPQKNDLYWMSLRASVGRNNDTNQGYLFLEFINTFSMNNWLTLNVTPKYFFSGVESFGGIGFSSYINLLENLLETPYISDGNFSSWAQYSLLANDENGRC